MLVQQQDARRLQRGHQQADRLALPARQQADAVGQAVLQPQAQGRQPLAETLAHRRLDGPAEAAPGAAHLGQRHVLFDGQVFAGARHGVLENPRHASGALPDRLAGHVGIVDAYGAGVDRQVAGDGIEKRRLAGSVGADDGHELAVRNVQRQPAQRARLDRRAGIEGNVQILGAQHVRPPSCRPGGA
ncbi:Uncharacterised protein [Bordetella pertussis]|nr:Uncharacterised protein [Bordetella pertussis]